MNNDHSIHYEKVKNYYEKGLWGITAVRNAVEKNWITIEEYEEIVGESYGAN